MDRTDEDRRYTVEVGGRRNGKTTRRIAAAWAVIEGCPFKDVEDGTCDHPANMTPECHAGACPFVKALRVLGGE